ncbi:MAG: cold shock and DUF1294 domain-containing protein [Rhodoferax sp.]|nr:cold shock and DUF1294 domain-containing protein [Rhodoferax sp.]
MRFTGTLKTWNDERGFGFLEPAQGGQEIFVHIKAFPSGTGRPSVGQVLTFEVQTGSDGKKKARVVQYPVRGRQSRRPRSESSAPWTLPRVLAIPAFVGIYTFVIWRWGFSPPVLLAYLGLSFLAFLAYAFDKSAAVSGRWRTAEQTLHLISLAGGLARSTGCTTFCATRQVSKALLYAFWFTVLVNVGAFVAWHAGLLPLPRPAGAA